MLGKNRIKQLTDAILNRSSADQTEVVVIADESALTRFANSTIHQNVFELDTEVRIRVVVGTRVGVATTNNLADEALNQTLETAIAIAKLQPENPDFKGLPAPQPIPEASAFCEDTANCSPERRAKAVGAICIRARNAKVNASGALTTAAVEIAVANSLGTFAYHITSFADLNTTAMSDNSAGYASLMALDINEMDFEALGQEAIEKCLRGRNPRSLEPGKYTVVLEPYATQDLLTMMALSGLSALSVQEGRSFMIDKFGKQIVDPRISIWDDGQDPAGIAMPFDFEGVPKQRVDMIKNGVANAVVYDSYAAGKEAGKSSTGHALPAPNTMGPFATNSFFATGDSNLDEMIKNTERGLLVTYFHYTRPVEPKRVVITGMTRNGTFLIENGEIAYPVKNLRFTQSYLDALNNVESIGKEAKLLSMFGVARQKVPAIKIRDFNFTGVTEF